MKFTSAKCLLSIAAVVGFVGCDKLSDSGTASDIKTLSKADSLLPVSTYEVITQNRPEDLQHYLKLMKANYDVCRFTAKLKEIAVKPFVHVPDDFIAERKTYISDGESFLESTETFWVDQASPEEGCATSIAWHKIVTVISDGFVYESASEQSLSEQSSGDNEVIKTPYDNSNSMHRDYTNYDIAKVISNVNLLCAKDLPGTSNLYESMCIVTDPTGKILLVPELKAIVGYMKIYSVREVQGTIILEPVSVKTGIPIDPKMFSMKDNQ